MELDIKIDYSDGAPFKIRQTRDGDIFYRQIEPQDQQFFEYIPQTQKYSQIKRMDGQSQLLLTSQINHKTVIIEDIKILNDRSDLFLVILIYDNQNTEHVYEYLSNLHTQQEKIRQQQKAFQKCVVVIIINNRHEIRLKMNEPQQYYDDSSAKLLVNWDIKGIKTQIFILNSRQDSHLLNNLIYQGLAGHFQPKYLLVQEICYKITNLDDYFNDIPIGAVAIVPQKDYEKQNNLNNQLMFKQYKLQYEQYINYHNKQNTYYDAFNCFYNYEIAKEFLKTNVLDIKDETKIQEFCYLNLQFCEQIYQRKFQIIQKNRIEFYYDDSQSSFEFDQNSKLLADYRKEFQYITDEPQKSVQFYLRALKLKKQLNFIQKQYLQINKLRLVQIVDYLQLSQCIIIFYLDLFIIIILPYYFIREQTVNQSIQVFISIIPGFIIVSLSIMLILINLIFCIGDPLIIGNHQKKAKLVIRKIKSKYYYHDYFGNNDKVQQLNESYCIEKGSLLFLIKPEEFPDLIQNKYHAFKLNPKIITYPILWIQNKVLNFIVIILNIIYCALIIYLLTYYIQNEDQIKQYISILIAVLIVIQLILSLQCKSR